MFPKDLFALDIGTTKFCLATLRERHGHTTPNVEIIGVPAMGMKKGMLANFAQAQKTLNALLQSAEKHFGCDIRRVAVGVAGSHLQGRKIQASIEVPGQIIQNNTVQKLIEKVEELASQENREILHVVPVSYRIDSRESIDDPVSFSGKMLYGEFFVIDADRLYLKDLVRLCNETGLEVSRLISEPFASASVTVLDSHKESGVILADIGGGTTDGLVFRDSKPCAIFTINIAGTLMTSDLAIGLGLPREEAERVKVFFGLLPVKKRSDQKVELAQKVDETVFEVKDVNGVSKVISWKDIYPILMPRVRELTTALQQKIQPFRNSMGAGVLLTGGGAEVLGIELFMTKWLGAGVRKIKPASPLTFLSSVNMPTHATMPTNVQGRLREEFAMKYATVLGLLNLELLRLGIQDVPKKNSLPFRYLRSFKNWFKEMS